MTRPQALRTGLAALIAAGALACGGGNDGPGAPAAAPNAGDSPAEAALLGKDCRAAGSGDVAYAQGSDFFCIAWRDMHSDEQAYRVAVKYLPSNEEFVYPAGADAVEVFLPRSDWPEDVRLQPGQCICEIARKDFEVTVHAVRASGEELVGRLEILRGEGF